MAENRQTSIDSRRIALEREVRLRFPAFDDFVTEFSANLSTTGMFIVSERPRAPGTEFNFEFSVADDWKLIRGTAQVVWARYRAEGEDRPAGMGARFVEVDAQSRRLIRWIVEKHVREGGKPFELDELKTTVDEALAGMVDGGWAAPAPGADHSRSGGTAGQAAPTRATPARPRRVLFGEILPIQPGTAAAIGVVVGLALLVWLSEVGPRLFARGAETEVATASLAPEAAPDDESGAAVGAGAADGAGAEQATDSASAVVPPRQAVETAVQSWARAWSDRDVDAYLASYGGRFQPPNGASRRAWSIERRQRLTRPEFIEVGISDLRVEILDDASARARFTQTYRSDTFSDVVTKRLDLVREDGAWKIAAERSES